MSATLLVAATFVVMLLLDWRFRLKSLRVCTALLALVVMFFAQPSPRRAAREAIAASPAERVAVLQGAPVSDYDSGVLTMERAVIADSRIGAAASLLSVGVLLWLACSPVLGWRRKRSGELEESGAEQRTTE
jgi:hypothetical protein